MKLNRLYELHENCNSAFGWTGEPHTHETYDERQEIMAKWKTMPGHTCYHDAILRLIKEHPDYGKPRQPEPR